VSAFHRHARTVTLLTLVSRLTGLARDAALSRAFGAGGVADAFFFAFMIPNLFRRLFGEGALSAAFLPAFARLDQSDPENARRLATLVVGGTTAVLSAIVLIGEAALLAVDRFGPGTSLAWRLAMIMLPYTPLVCLVAVAGAMLQVRGRFGPTAAAPVILNGCILAATIGGALLFAPDGDGPATGAHVSVVAASVLVAGVVQVAWTLAALGRGAWGTRDLGAARDAARGVGAQVLPMIVGLGAFQLNTFLDGVIASYPAIAGPTILGRPYPLDIGAMAAISYATRLYQFPLGVFGIAVATAIFPALARMTDDAAGFAETLRRGLRIVVFIGLPASAGLILVREPLAAAILQGGDFTSDDSRRVGFVLLGYAPGVWAYSMMHVLTRALYARGDARSPVRVALAVLGLNLALNCTLIWTPLREAGLAWSTATCAIVQAVALTAILRRRIGPFLTRAVAASWARTIVATAIMIAVVLVAARLLPADGATWSRSALVLAVLTAAGAGAYGAAALVMRMPELRWSLGAETR
jgi:putative peptidoglycan lipid II flippase